MRIAMISDYESTGGAAIACSRLAAALVEAGHEVVRVVGRADTHEHNWETVALEFPDVYKRLARLAAPRDHPELWIKPAVERALDRTLTKIEPDVVNLHNLHGHRARGWSPRFAEVALEHAPTVWTLHDMWSFTGRCAYRQSCERHVVGCDASCPTPTEYPALAPRRIADSWMDRRELLTQHPAIAAVTPSRWLAHEAAQGLWSGHRIEVIANGLPLERYAPVDKDVARRALGLATPQPVIVVAAQKLDDRRKGMDLLVEALDCLNHSPPIIMLALGEGGLPELKGTELIQMGYVSDDRLKAIVYSAADFLVHPAREDNLPIVVQEAMACGTPVVAFETGGVPEMVVEGKTGWIAADQTPDALASTIELALNSEPNVGPTTGSCRMFAERSFDPTVWASRYEALFQELLR